MFFEYLMVNIDEITSDYNVTVAKIDDLSWSFHQNKKVLYYKI